MINIYNFGHNREKKFGLKKGRLGVNIFLIVAIVICVLAVSTLFVYLVNMGILPFKYVIICLAASLIVAIVSVLMLWLSKKHRITTTLYGIFLIIVSAAICFGLVYLIQTRNFFSQTKAREFYVINYSIYVHQDSEFQELQDLNDKRLATYIDTVTSYTEAFDELKQQINFSTTLNNTYLDAVSSFKNHEADFIMLSDSYVDILNDLEENFSETIRKIYTIDIKVFESVEVRDVDVLHEPFNIYISGIDVKGDISTVSRSDVNMIVTINPNTHKILLTSIPRDFYMQLHGTTGLKDKLTHSGIYGPTMTVKTVEDFLNIDINYFVRVNFSSVMNLVDAIGGVYLTPNITLYRNTDGVGCYYQKDVKELFYGACALRYARERKAYGTGDIQRIQNQQQVLTAILDKLMSPEIIKNYSSILAAVQSNFETSLPEQKIYQLINNQLDSMPKWEVLDCHMEGFDSHSDIYSYGKNEAGDYGVNYYYVMEPNYDTVEAAKAKIKAVFAGE